jgi:exopolyphosphatase / guanosine-5'-triphosphate,3'-diphosphate pyrophosphatase
VRVAVLDMGTNSTRLLVADVRDQLVTEVERQTKVTRLGRGVDTSEQLAAEAIEETCEAVRDYITLYEEAVADRVVAIATSAVRDAANGDAFIAELRERFGLEARILEGDEEARLTYAGALAGRDETDRTLVIDIGGGSTELIVGEGADILSHTSLQAGVVRHTERHLTSDPPQASELEDLATDVRGLIDDEIAQEPLAVANDGIAVAGTPVSLAAIDHELDHNDSDRVQGHKLSLASIQTILSRLASVPLDQRLGITGLHPDRAPTIVAGVVILIEAMRAFGLSKIEVSEHDLLWGAAIEAGGAST